MLSDETLTLFCYGDELDDAERRAVERALATDDALAKRYATLVADLQILRELPAPELPPEALVRWRYELDRVATPPRQRVSWLVFGTTAAALFFGVVIGLRIGLDAPDVAGDPNGGPVTGPQIVATPGVPSSAPAEFTGNAPAFARGLVSYMQDSQVQLAGLQDSDQRERAALLMRILDQNKAFERSAESRGAHDVARVLRAFEQVLRSLATDAAAQGDIANEAAQLSFEYAAMLTRLTQQASKEPYQL